MRIQDARNLCGSINIKCMSDNELSLLSIIIEHLLTLKRVIIES